MILRVRRVAPLHHHLDDRRRVDARALVREGVESELAGDTSNPACACAAVGQARDAAVQERLIRDGRAGLRAAEEGLFGGRVLGEDIRHERVVFGVDDRDRLVQPGDGNDGEQRAEDLVGHEGVVELDVLHDRRRDEPVCLVRLPTEHNRALRPVQHRLHPRELRRAPEAPVRVRLGGSVGVELVVLDRERVEQLRLELLGDEDVVGRDADLARVAGLAPEQAARGELQVARGVDVDGVLPAELEGYGGEVLRGCGGDDAAYASRAGVEDCRQGVLA